MRYVVVGAGAVGGTIGGRLAQHGHDVVLVARGAHLEALRRDGLRLLTPTGEHLLPIPATDAAGLSLLPGDVLVLATKTQDTAAVLADLSGLTLPDGTPAGVAVPVICAQNGVANERIALRRFDRVYAMTVWLPATHLDPGVVIANGGPLSGILDFGRYPEGIDELVTAVAADLEASEFGALALKQPMRRKYGKLLANLANALEAVFGTDHDAYGDLRLAAMREGRDVLAAAGIDVASREEEQARRGKQVELLPVAGTARTGGSTWQSMARGATSLEVDFLNGEIALLGREHGVPTPVNAIIQALAAHAVRARLASGTLSPDDARARITAAGGRLAR